jgi:hypothetical protein
MQAHMTDANPSTPSGGSPPTRYRRFVASPTEEASIDEICTKEKTPSNRIEDMPRDELRRRWVTPAEELARLQIARLDGMIHKLIGRIQGGDLEAIDCALTIVTRLDQHPRFSRELSLPERYSEGDRARLLKLNEAAARLQSETPEE